MSSCMDQRGVLLLLLLLPLLLPTKSLFLKNPPLLEELPGILNARTPSGQA